MTPEMIIIAGLIVVAYAALANRLFALGRSYRDELYDLIEDFRSDPTVPEYHRKLVEGVPDGAVEARTAWKLLAALIAVTIRSLFAAKKSNSTTSNDNLEILSPEAEKIWLRIARTSIMCVLCTSPLALIVFLLLIGAASFVSPGDKLAEDTMAEAVTRGIGPSHAEISASRAA